VTGMWHWVKAMEQVDTNSINCLIRLNELK
jgi:hypothetical protein